MVDWTENGGSRLDLDLDGDIDHPGAAIMDRAWTKIANAFMEPRLAASSTSWDLVRALRLAARRPVLRLAPVLRPRHPCSARREGPEARSRTPTAATATSRSARTPSGGDQEAVDELTVEQGTDVEAWRSDAVRERIDFSPLPPTTMRYTNRPTGSSRSSRSTVTASQSQIAV